MANPIIENLVAQLAKGINTNTQAQPQKLATSVEKNTQETLKQDLTPKNTGKFTVADYPIFTKHPEVCNSPTGKNVSEITLQKVANGEVENGDVRISRQMLLNQADVAQSAGKDQVAGNLRRASELTEVPDDVVIKMYDMLRPNRATKQALSEMANTLKTTYNAPLCAKLVLEASEVYEKRGILL